MRPMKLDQFLEFMKKRKKSPVCNCRYCGRPMYENPLSSDIGPDVEGNILDDIDEKFLEDIAGEKRLSDVCSECFREKAFERTKKRSKYNNNLH